MTAGYSDTYTRVDDGRDYYNYANQCVVEATVTHIFYERITINDVELLGGRGQRWFDEEGTFVWAEDTKGFNSKIEQTVVGAFLAARK